MCVELFAGWVTKFPNTRICSSFRVPQFYCTGCRLNWDAGISELEADTL
jgi:hypothetical protein